MPDVEMQPLLPKLSAADSTTQRLVFNDIRAVIKPLESKIERDVFARMAAAQFAEKESEEHEIEVQSCLHAVWNMLLAIPTLWVDLTFMYLIQLLLHAGRFLHLAIDFAILFFLYGVIGIVGGSCIFYLSCAGCNSFAHLFYNPHEHGIDAWGGRFTSIIFYINVLLLGVKGIMGVFYAFCKLIQFFDHHANCNAVNPNNLKLINTSDWGFYEDFTNTFAVCAKFADSTNYWIKQTCVLLPSFMQKSYCVKGTVGRYCFFVTLYQGVKVAMWWTIVKCWWLAIRGFRHRIINIFKALWAWKKAHDSIEAMERESQFDAEPMATGRDAHPQ